MRAIRTILDHRPFAFAVLILPSGCAWFSSKAIAGNEFANAFMCPRDRVVVTARPDIPPHAVMGSATPPAEIAADPQRLAMWRQQQVQKDAGRGVYDVQGCGHEARYVCGMFDVGGDVSSMTCVGNSSSHIATEIASALATVPAASDSTSVVTESTVISERGPDVSGQADLVELALEMASRPHPRLGASFRDVNDGGVVVVAVAAGGPSDGKLQAGDVITSVDGLAVTCGVDLLRVMAKHAPSSPLALTVKRGMTTLPVSIDVGP